MRAREFLIPVAGFLLGRLAQCDRPETARDLLLIVVIPAVLCFLAGLVFAGGRRVDG